MSEEGLVQFAASVGAPIAGQRVRIADAQDRELSDRSVGEIQIAGPCVMRGYHLDPDATRRALAEDGFLRTGERGYIADGSLYVLGRTTGARERAGNLCDALEAGPAERAVPALQGSSPRA